jgi:hypothetical protein
MTDIYSGDPLISLGPDGADFTYIGGQPVMDAGVSNQALIPLFTSDQDPISGKNWPGNIFLSALEQIGSDYQRLAQGPQTLKTLHLIEDAALRALSDPIFDKVSAVATNPNSSYIEVVIHAGQGTLIIGGNESMWKAQLGL